MGSVTTGGQNAFIDNTTLSYNASTGVLTSTFAGDLTGNVTGNLTGDVTGNVSGNAGTVTSGFYRNNIGGGTVSITPVANTPTSGNVSWGRTLSATPVVVASANTAVPGTVVTGVGTQTPTTTGCTVYVTRTNTTSTSITAIGIVA